MVYPSSWQGQGNALAGHIGSIFVDPFRGITMPSLTLKKFDGSERKEGLCTQGDWLLFFEFH